jgi:hypothetical protein
MEEIAYPLDFIEKVKSLPHAECIVELLVSGKGAAAGKMLLLEHNGKGDVRFGCHELLRALETGNLEIIRKKAREAQDCYNIYEEWLRHTEVGRQASEA